jgi:nucleoid-associated protein EbfC
MFGDLLGNMQKQQEDLKKVLSETIISEKSNDGLVSIECTATREIKNITIDVSLLNKDGKDQLEDQLVVTINKALEQAAIKEAAEAQKLLQNVMPPGLGGLGDLFK